MKASHVVWEFDETAENDQNVCFAWGPLSNSPSDSSVLKLCHTRYSFVLSWARQEGAIQGSVTINESEIEFINYFFTPIKLIIRQSEYNYSTFPFLKCNRHTMKYHYHHHLWSSFAEWEAVFLLSNLPSRMLRYDIEFNSVLIQISQADDLDTLPLVLCVSKPRSRKNRWNQIILIIKKGVRLDHWAESYLAGQACNNHTPPPVKFQTTKYALFVFIFLKR